MARRCGAAAFARQHAASVCRSSSCSRLRSRLSTLTRRCRSLASLHRLLGLDERLVLEVCRGVPMVAQRFSNWAKGRRLPSLAYDDEPPAGGDLPFVQYWAKGALEGLARRVRGFLARKRCARLGRCRSPAKKPQPVSASYGYHLDAPAYSELVSSSPCGWASKSSFGRGKIDSRSTGEQIKGIDPRRRDPDRRGSLCRCVGRRGAADRPDGRRASSNRGASGCRATVCSQRARRACRNCRHSARSPRSRAAGSARSRCRTALPCSRPTFDSASAIAMMAGACA